jgi:hypothetical protein
MIFSRKHPKPGYVYAITKGTYLGELFVSMEKIKNEHIFLSLPEMKIRAVPEDKFELGIKTGIIDIVEKLPRRIYGVCRKQYSKNLNPNLIKSITA